MYSLEKHTMEGVRDYCCMLIDWERELELKDASYLVT